MPKYWALGAALAVSIGVSSVHAQTIPDEYAKSIQEHSRIATLDGGFFGDHVGLSTGNLEFTQTDVALPGNDALAVRAGRRFRVGNSPAQGHFADWDLDIPHLHGIFGGSLPTNVAWEVNSLEPDHRCSEFGAPPEINTSSGGGFGPDEYWEGTFLYLPGGGDQELLGAGGDVPASNGPYPVVTREGAVARCLSALATGSEAGATGEAFQVVTPDGTTYTFNHMVSRYADDLFKSDPVPLLRAGGSRGTVTRRAPGATQGVDAGTNAVTCCTMKRREIFLYPTQVTDRFGNTVTYTWDSANPWRLLHITGSDGRDLAFSYSSSDASSFLVQSISDGAHSWSYAYAGSTPGVHLSSVTQPDEQAWQFNLTDLYSLAKPHLTALGCDAGSTSGSSQSGSITAPSGASAAYTVASKLFGRSWVVRDCKVDEMLNERIIQPYLFASMAIVSKTITGPGLPGSGLQWTYAYGSANNCWDPDGVPAGDSDAVICTANWPDYRTTTVTAPDGAQSRYTFGNRVQFGIDVAGNEGLLRSEEHGVSGATALKTTAYAYGEGDAAPYGVYQGHSVRRRGDWRITGQRRPQRSVITTQQGATFSWVVPATCSNTYCFDFRSRPIKVVRTGVNTPTANQAETIAYDDDTTRWVLGQVASRTIAGVVAGSTTFDASHRPWKIYAFGKLQNTFTYNTDGTIATVTDGNGNVTTYADWKRGVPKTVHFPGTPDWPAGGTREANVDDWGRITWVKDENGYVTGYEYDDMGRITKVTYPSDEGWAPTISDFSEVNAPENGLPAGHWRQRVNTGNGYKDTFYDALWRPVLVHEYDTSVGGVGTDRYVATAYDAAGRQADVSYPLSSAPTMSSGTWWLLGVRPPGVRTQYDALGRPTLVQQDSELGAAPLETKTAYLTPFTRRVTDARLNVTTEQFMAWDTPSFDLPVQIDAPEGQSTTIVRDTFGKPTSITRGGNP